MIDPFDILYFVSGTNFLLYFINLIPPLTLRFLFCYRISTVVLILSLIIHNSLYLSLPA